MNKPIHVAMVGGGINSAVGRVHEIAMKMDNAFELVAGCFSRNPELNAQSGKLYGVAPAQIYSSTEQLIEQCHTEIDAIVIATPIQSHASAIHLALDHNLKVISDKPLLSNMQECADLLKRVTPENTEVISIFNYTGYPAVREMKRRIESGQIGHVFKIMAEMPQDSYMRLSNQNKTSAIQPWRLKDGTHTLAEYCGDSATIYVAADGTSRVEPGLRRCPTPAPPLPHPTFGAYRQRALARGRRWAIAPADRRQRLRQRP